MSVMGQDCESAVIRSPGVRERCLSGCARRSLIRFAKCTYVGTRASSVIH